jgi:uncharacterized protein
MKTDVSEERLNALLDDELSGAEAEALLERLQADPALRERLAQLQLVQRRVRHAYRQLAPPRQSRSDPGRRVSGPRMAAVAVLFAAGALAGWFGHGARTTTSDAAVEVATAATSTDHIVVHLSVAAPDAARAALDRAEGILDAARGSGRSVAVEVVANGGGLDLLREGVSPYADRIAQLRAQHPSLAFIACGQTAQRLREAGVDVRLLPGTVVATSALDEIVRRMQEGWTYLRI